VLSTILMCTTSYVNATSIPLMQQQGISSALSIHITQLKKNIANYTLIDVREKDEIDIEKGIEKAIHIPLGSLLFQAAANKLDHLKDKQLVVFCGGDYRSAIATRELVNFGFNVHYLNGGLEAWKDIAAASFDFVVNFGFNKSEVDKLSMALTFAYNAQLKSPTCLILTSDGVFLSVPGALDDVVLGEPFVPAKKMLENFLKEGGTVFGCRSCIKLRKLEIEKLSDFMHPCSSPDVVRWLKSASGSIQYL